MQFLLFGLGFLALAACGTAQANTETWQLNAYYLGDRATIFSQAESWQPGSVHPLNLVLTDQETNVTQGQIRGYCVSLAQEESMCLHTITLASGTIQVSVLAGFAYGANRPYDTSKDAVLAVAGELFVPGGPSSGTPTFADQDQGSILSVIGGTGLYTGATGYYQQTAPPTSPASLAAASTATAPSPAPAASQNYQPLNGVKMQVTYGASS